MVIRSNLSHYSENSDVQSIFGRSASAVIPSEKRLINTNRKFTTLSHEPKMNIVRFPYAPSKEGGSKTQDGRFPWKIALHLKKVCNKVSLCEFCQRHSCKAFTVLSIRAKNGSQGTFPTTVYMQNLPETGPLLDDWMINVQACACNSLGLYRTITKFSLLLF